MQQEISTPQYISSSYKRIVDAFLNNENSIPPIIDSSGVDVPEALRDFRYGVCSLPVLITQAQRAGIEHFGKTLPRVMYQSISSWFDGREAEFESIYKRPRILYQLLRSVGPLFFQNLFFRCDFVFANQVIKALEVNVGSNVGGYQISQYQKVIEGNMNKLLPGETINYINTLSFFFERLFYAMSNHLKGRITGNVLIVSRNDYSDLWKKLVTETFERSKSSPFENAECIFITDISDLTYTPSGHVSYNKKILDCVLVSSGATAADIQRINMAHFGRKVFSPDNSLSTIFAPKMNFAIMHAARMDGQLDEESSSFVSQHIPPTYFLTGKGVPSDIITLLLNEKDQWVIKKSHSWQGQDVMVGRFTSHDDWKNAILSSKGSEETWIAQQYVQPDKLPIVDNNDVRWFDAVWGSFGFCESYGGAMIRFDSSDRCNGVINAARGATESLVLEYC